MNTHRNRHYHIELRLDRVNKYNQCVPDIDYKLGEDKTKVGDSKFSYEC